MGGIGLLVRAEIRRRWVALVLIGLLAGVVGASVVTAVAGARRSDTAYDRLADLTGQPDATLVSFVDPAFVDAVADLPEVEEVWRLRGVVSQVLDVPEVVYLSIVSGPPRPPGIFTPKVEEGRLPVDDAAGEVAIAAGLAEAFDVAVGDVLRVGLLTQDEFESFDEGFGEPDGPTLDLELVGTFTVAGNETTEQVGILGSPAFAAIAAEGGGGDGAMMELSDQPGSVASFEAGVLELSEEFDLPDDAAELGVYDLKLAADDRDRYQSAAGVVARGLLLAGVAGLVVGLLGVAQTALRHLTRGLGIHPALLALGFERRQRLLVALMPFALVSAPLVVAITVGGAIALSPLLPIGVAREVEPSPGVEVNLAVLGIGVVVALVLFFLVVGLVALRASRREPGIRPSGSPLLGRWTTSSLPMPVTVGTGLAFERGRGGAAAPVRAALVGGVVAVAAVVGSAAFAASLDRLVDTPERYGSPGDLLVADAQDELVTQVLGDPDVEAVLEVRGFDLVIDGTRRDTFGTDVLKGSIGFNYVSGRPPSGPAEVALGPALVSRLGKGLGDTVRLDEVDRDATIVGIVLARGDTGDRYADTAVVDDEIRREVSSRGSFREVMLRYAPGVDVEAASAELAQDYEIERFAPPARLRDVAQVRNLPLILAAAAGLLGLGLLGHALVVTVRRRGNDLALLRALGARPRDTVLSVLAMTVIMVTVGVGVGIPVGLLLGNLAWRQLADSLFVASDLAVPVLVLALVLPVALVVGLLAAAIPTRRASRLEVAELLRRE